MTLHKCDICDGHSDAMREHCKYCGARRAFICSHSYEPYRVVVQARNAQNLNRQIVRAYRTNVAFNFVSE